VKVIMISYSRFQILELRHINKGFISYIYIANMSSILVTRYDVVSTGELCTMRYVRMSDESRSWRILTYALIEKARKTKRNLVRMTCSQLGF